jgi:citrate synthase
VIDISKLYGQTGAFTYDPGFTSTASCESKITYIDGDAGVLLYRGYPIEAAGGARRLPRDLLPPALRGVAHAASEGGFRLSGHAPHNGARSDEPLLPGVPARRAPMAIMVASVGALSAFYHDSTDISDEHQRMIAQIRMIAKMPTLAACAYKYSIGQPFIYPMNSLDYTSNFLRMCFAVPCEEYKVNPVSRVRSTASSSCMPITSRTPRPPRCGSPARRVPTPSPASRPA